MSELLENAVREIVNRLANCEYREAVDLCVSSRLTATDLRDTIADYGRTLVALPAAAYQHLDAVKINDRSKHKWSLRIPLWTQEEGRSDLTLELTVILDDNHAYIELDDLQVL